MKNILKFSALTLVVSLFVFGCSQTEEPLQGPAGPTSGLFLDEIGLDVPKSPLDGTETLGIPSITIAEGTGLAIGGAGLRFTQPGTITIPDADIPDGATIEQVLLYWEGFNSSASGDGQVTVNGTHPVTGVQLNNPTLFFTSGGGGPENWSVAYRADITSLGLIDPNVTNNITVEDYVVNRPNGAGLLVIYDDGSDAVVAGVRDGDDCAYHAFPPTLDTTVEQIFNFPAASSARTATLNLMAGSVQMERPNRVLLRFDGGSPVYVDNPFGDTEGEDFDAVEIQVTVPAGVTSMSAQCLSEAPPGEPGDPASLVWICAALEIPIEREGESCTPGYWKNFRMHYCEWDAAGYTPTMDFDATFGTDYFNPDISLMSALRARGGDGNGYGRLARHGTAALLNAANPDVDFPMTEAEVKAAVQAGNASLLAGYNEDFPCPLNNCKDNVAPQN
ncbi:MAG: hypothetical protein JSW58_09160 [Candidatus Latescibacterota bacterium]|nr:MAG: hypothetical protein JSW58_09160 [Candidatus Latescibacterota bacterium]